MLFVLVLMLCACSAQSVSYPEGYENAPAQTLLAEGLARHEQGNFEEALEFFDAAYLLFERQNDKAKMAETLSARSLTLRRLSRLEEALADLQNAVEMTEGTGGVVLPLYNLAKVKEAMGDPACVETYQRALDAMLEFQPSPIFRPAVVNDMQLHLAVAKLLFNQDSDGTAEVSALAAIGAILNDEELDSFAKMVWSSGGYMGLAEYYIPLDAEKAWYYFDRAEEIIFAYPDATVLRRQDIEALRGEMPPRPEAFNPEVTCGNGTCQSPENSQTCPADCGN